MKKRKNACLGSCKCTMFVRPRKEDPPYEEMEQYRPDLRRYLLGNVKSAAEYQRRGPRGAKSERLEFEREAQFETFRDSVIFEVTEECPVYDEYFAFSTLVPDAEDYTAKDFLEVWGERRDVCAFVKDHGAVISAEWMGTGVPRPWLRVVSRRMPLLRFELAYCDAERGVFGEVVYVNGAESQEVAQGRVDFLTFEEVEDGGNQEPRPGTVFAAFCESVQRRWSVPAAPSREPKRTPGATADSDSEEEVPVPECILARTQWAQ